MSIELTEDPEQHLLIVKASGKLSAQDYHDFEPAVDRLIESGKIKILFEMCDFHGWEAGAMWEDIKFATRHSRDVERIAMVGEKSWEKWMATICKPFTMSKIKYFGQGEFDAAQQWVASQ